MQRNKIAVTIQVLVLLLVLGIMWNLSAAAAPFSPSGQEQPALATSEEETLAAASEETAVQTATSEPAQENASSILQPNNGTSSASEAPQSNTGNAEPASQEVQNASSGQLREGTSVISSITEQPNSTTSEVSSAQQAPRALIDITPRYIPVDATSAIVYTFAEMKEVLEGDNGITTIYLGADITELLSGIQIPASKLTVTIDGTPPNGAGGPYTYTQYAGSALSSTIKVRPGVTQEVIVRNINVMGYNFYGIVSATDTSSNSNLMLTFRNITYSGPQLIYNTYGKAQIFDSTITIQKNGSGGSASQEMAEVNQISFGGNVTINHTTAVTYGVCWLYRTNPSFTVLAGANVKITTPTFVVYNGVDTPDMVIQANAKLDVQVVAGFTYATMKVSNVTLQENAQFIMAYSGSKASGALNIDGDLTLQQGSVLDVRCPNSTGSVLNMVGSPTIQFNQPQRVILSSSSGKPFAFANNKTIAVSITTQLINRWLNSSAVDDNLNFMPDYIWRQPDNTALTVTANYSGQTLSNVTSNYNNSPMADTFYYSSLDTSTFSLTSGKLFSCGSMVLQSNLVYDKSTSITGTTTSPSANLSASITTTSGSVVKVTGTADASGKFSVPLNGAAPKLGSTFALLGASGGLRTYQILIVQSSAFLVLSFSSVPSTLPFGTVPLQATTVMLPRQDANWNIGVSDMRPTKTAWSLNATMAQPLSATSGTNTYTLPNALVFVNSSGVATPLGTSPTLIYSQAAGGPQSTTIGWDATHGPMLQLAPGQARSGLNYSGTIQWTLVSAP